MCKASGQVGELLERYGFRYGVQLEVERELQDDIGAGYPCAMAMLEAGPKHWDWAPEQRERRVLGGGAKKVEKRQTISNRQVV